MISLTSNDKHMYYISRIPPRPPHFCPSHSLICHYELKGELQFYCNVLLWLWRNFVKFEATQILVE